MSVNLSDLSAAVADYVERNVTVEVSEVKHGISTVPQPHEKGTFNVTVTNNGAVRLTDLVYELSVSPGSVAKLISPDAPAGPLLTPEPSAAPPSSDASRRLSIGGEALSHQSNE
jgi:uncharacterized repeat protein (TIGR01451 family)